MFNSCRPRSLVLDKNAACNIYSSTVRLKQLQAAAADNHQKIPRSIPRRDSEILSIRLSPLEHSPMVKVWWYIRESPLNFRRLTGEGLNFRQYWGRSCGLSPFVAE
jgi:hypothetical protein